MNRRTFLSFGLAAPLSLVVPATSAPAVACGAAAVGYFDWAESEGARLYAAQVEAHRIQLMALTDGIDVEAFIGDRQREIVELLRSIRKRIESEVTP